MNEKNATDFEPEDRFDVEICARLKGRRVPGPDAEFRARIHAAMAAEHRRARRPRTFWVSGAAAAIVVVGIAVVVMSRDGHPSDGRQNADWPAQFTVIATTPSIPGLDAIHGKVADMTGGIVEKLNPLKAAVVPAEDVPAAFREFVITAFEGARADYDDLKNAGRVFWNSSVPGVLRFDNRGLFKENENGVQDDVEIDAGRGGADRGAWSGGTPGGGKKA